MTSTAPPARAGSELAPPRVVCAAIRHRRIGLVICGPRHFDATMHAQIEALDRGAWRFRPVQWKDAEQGFVDQFGNFLTREEAWDVAYAQGQIRRNCGPVGTLYSEHLY